MNEVTTQTLADFLLARIAEDEQAATMASGPSWNVRDRDDGYFFVASDRMAVASAERPEDRLHIARHDPARVLAECEAKRRIVKRHATCNDMSYGEPCPDLRDLAGVHADHADFRPEWRP